MNLNKHLEFFNPLEIEDDIHIIGLGAIGSNLALMLTRLGCNNIHLYDFDTVEEINLANQNYYEDQIKRDKTLATLQNMLQINSKITFELHNKGWNPETCNLSGYVFLCLDNIDTRRAVVEICKNNRFDVGYAFCFILNFLCRT